MRWTVRAVAASRACTVRALFTNSALAVLSRATGLGRLRGATAPSEHEYRLFNELHANITALVQVVPPSALRSASAPPLSTFAETARGLGLLPLPQDFPPPPPDEAEEQAKRRLQSSFAPGERATLLVPLPSAPPGCTARDFHRLPSLEGVQFFEQAVVADVLEDDQDGAQLDSQHVSYSFSVREPSHALSFAIGTGSDGSPLLTYSVPHAFYQLPDGSKWAEHTDLYDLDDVRAQGRKTKLPFRQLLEDIRERELLAAQGRRHTNLDDAEYECHVFSRPEFDRRTEAGELPPEAFFCRKMFDPERMSLVGPWAPPTSS